MQALQKQTNYIIAARDRTNGPFASNALIECTLHSKRALWLSKIELWRFEINVDSDFFSCIITAKKFLIYYVELFNN